LVANNRTILINGTRWNHYVVDLDGFVQHIYGILKSIKKKDKTFRAFSVNQEVKFNEKS
jgi:hypothetical protein